MEFQQTLSFWNRLINEPVGLMSLISSIIIASITIIILIRQHQYQKLSYKSDMFDKKVKVYSDVMMFISNIVQKREVKPEDHFQFYSIVTLTRLLFNKKTYNYVSSIYDKAVEYSALKIKLEEFSKEFQKAENIMYPNQANLPVKEKELSMDKLNELNKWFIAELKRAPSIIEEEIKLQ